MKTFYFILSACIIFSFCHRPPPDYDPLQEEISVCRIMFWNAENLFDCFKDSLCEDSEFLPYGIRGWNNTRYKQKLNKMYKVFIAAGNWEPPDLIGLCEIENKNVLFGLLRDTPFSYYAYRFIHFESPDRRGIDVALLYNPKTINVLGEKAIAVQLSDSPDSRSRDILYVRVKIISGDTLSVFVNHWPSKYGGPGFTADLRETVGEILLKSLDSLRTLNPREKIIVLGDFNDPPESNSLRMLSVAGKEMTLENENLLINLSEEYKGSVPGSYKFSGSWQMIDQILVSKNLISGDGKVCIKPMSFRVFSPEFILEKDEKYGGVKPNRTYTGMIYHGGYSDHLPVILDLFEKN